MEWAGANLFGGDEQSGHAEQLKAVLVDGRRGQEPVDQIDGQQERLDVVVELLVHLHQPPDQFGSHFNRHLETGRAPIDRIASEKQDTTRTIIDKRQQSFGSQCNAVLESSNSCFRAIHQNVPTVFTRHPIHLLMEPILLFLFESR